MKELYIDFDGVILDTISILYKKFEEVGLDPKDNTTESQEKRLNFLEKLDWNKLIKETPQINDSINCIQRIIDSKKFFVSILTHVNSLEEAVAKVNYIRQYLKDITIIPVPKKISKTKMVHSRNAILIDDYSGNLRQWQEEGGIGIRFSTKRNGKGFFVIDKLDQILELEI